MRRFGLSLIFAAAALGVPSAALAGDPIALHPFAAIDFNAFAATKTYKAIFGSSSIPGYGGGVDIEHLWRNVFVRVAATRVSKTGSRVFVNGTDVFKLSGEPAKLTETPIEIGGGWLFRMKNSKLTPYVGGAAFVESYKVDYSASPDLNESETFTGTDIFGGLQFAITKVLIVGGEAQFRILPNALKSDLASSVANVYNEKQGGGVTARVTIGVRIGK